MKSILIIEADYKLAERMGRAMMDVETHVYTCSTFASAVALLEREVFQLIIIDTMLPDGDGYALTEKLKNGFDVSKNPAVILIVPYGESLNVQKLNELSISDYITKPFNTAVLKAKVWTQFKRRKKEAGYHAISRFEAIGAGSKRSVIGEHLVVIDAYRFNFDVEEYRIAGKKYG